MPVNVRLRRTIVMLAAATLLFALGSAELIARASGPRPLGAGELVWWDDFRQEKLIALMNLIADGPRLGGGGLAPRFDAPKPVPSSAAQLGFDWPVGSVRAITSLFGYRRDPMNPGASQFHHGLDIRCDWGEPIGSAHRGSVHRTGYSSVYGNWVIVEHAYGFKTFYGHMSSIRASAGENVSRGETVGLCGSTGRSTGAHVHFGVRHAQGIYDPLAFLPR